MWEGRGRGRAGCWYETLVANVNDLSGLFSSVSIRVAEHFRFFFLYCHGPELAVLVIRLCEHVPSSSVKCPKRRCRPGRPWAQHEDNKPRQRVGLQRAGRGSRAQGVVGGSGPPRVDCPHPPGAEKLRGPCVCRWEGPHGGGSRATNRPCPPRLPQPSRQAGRSGPSTTALTATTPSPAVESPVHASQR